MMTFNARRTPASVFAIALSRNLETMDSSGLPA